MQIEFTNPRFYRKTDTFARFPEHNLPEISVIGKSNVGKSSFLNHFLKNPKLTVTSSKPGRTQEYFFFNVQDKVIFVDLPGYGFAEVSKVMKQKWAETLRQYIKNRKQLKMVLFLQDIRRTPSEEDLEILDLILENNLAMILLLTKVDKLSKNEREKKCKKILEVLDVEGCVTVYYSATENLGRPELSRHINQAFDEILNAPKNQSSSDTSSESDELKELL